MCTEHTQCNAWHDCRKYHNAHALVSEMIVAAEVMKAAIQLLTTQGFAKRPGLQVCM